MAIFNTPVRETSPLRLLHMGHALVQSLCSVSVHEAVDSGQLTFQPLGEQYNRKLLFGVPLHVPQTDVHV